MPKLSCYQSFIQSFSVSYQLSSLLPLKHHYVIPGFLTFTYLKVSKTVFSLIDLREILLASLLHGHMLTMMEVGGRFIGLVGLV